MNRQLKRKFVVVSTLSAFVMLLVVLFCINFFNYRELRRTADNMLSYIIEQKGELPNPGKNNPMDMPPNNFSREAMFDTRFFVVYYDDTGLVVDSRLDRIFSVSSDSVQTYATTVIEKGKESGIINGYKYRCAQIDGKSAIVFLDIAPDMQLAKKNLYNSIYIALAALLFVSMVSYLFSSYAVKPVVTAYEKQKKFITNASHEIKTPLTIISANMDILEVHDQENKWIRSSKEQILRLTDLVNNLVRLSKMDESEKVLGEEFNISEMVEMTAESYQSISKIEKKNLFTAIDPNITYRGSSKDISQMLYLLLDNAFKYSNEGGDISITLTNHKGKVHLTVSNSVEVMRKGNYQQLFDRFYRPDESRNSKTGGFGIGLALAKSIVEKHKGKIYAKCIEENQFTIEVFL